MTKSKKTEPKSAKRIAKEAAAADERAEMWPGLENITDGAAARGFVASVESAFEALHQAAGGLGGPDEDDAEDDAPILVADFRTWADSVEDRMEYMGLGRQGTGLPPPNSSKDVLVDAVSFRKWTLRVWARLAALGQVIE